MEQKVIEAFDILKLVEYTNKQAARIAQLEGELLANRNAKDPSKSDDLAELFSDLAKAQAEMPIADLNNQNRYFKTDYADLKSLVGCARPSLTKYGLCVTQDILYHDNGQSILYTRLGHTSGQFIESRMAINPPKNDIQTLTSYLASLKRLAYGSLIGVVTNDEDDDGEIAMISAREVIAKGPSAINKYNPKEQSFETITKEQLDELEYELAEYPDLAEEILDRLRLQSLADLPKSKYTITRKRIMEIKNLRNTSK